MLSPSCIPPNTQESKKKKKEWHCFGQKHSLFVQNVIFIYNTITQWAWLCHQAWSGFHEMQWERAHLPLSMQAISVWVKTGKQSHVTTNSSPSLAGYRKHALWDTSTWVAASPSLSEWFLIHNDLAHGNRSRILLWEENRGANKQEGYFLISFSTPTSEAGEVGNRQEKQLLGLKWRCQSRAHGGSCSGETGSQREKRRGFESSIFYVLVPGFLWYLVRDYF